jgi:hypothetical protein
LPFGLKTCRPSRCSHRGGSGAASSERYLTEPTDQYLAVHGKRDDGMSAAPLLNGIADYPEPGTPPLYVREDWTLFRSLGTLGQKAGVPVEKLPRLVLKELGDNALDNTGWCDFCGHKGFYLVADDGAGIPGTDQEIAALFSIGRPLTSSKLIRLPTRGALGNGLRVVAGAVLASGGTLAVSTRGRTLHLVPQDDGTTEVIASEPWEGQGTEVMVSFGKALAGQNDDVFAWVRLASDLAGGKRYTGKSPPHCYDPESFWELLQAAGDRTVQDQVADLEGLSRDKAAAIAADFRGRSCSSLARPEARELLALARENATPVHPRRLGFVGRLREYPGYGRDLGTYTYGVKSAGGDDLNAVVPLVIEAWAKPSEKPSIDVCVNRTPITADVCLQRDAENPAEYILFGCNLGYAFRAKRGRHFALLVNVQTMYMPITTDGKEPDLNEFWYPIKEALEKAIRTAGGKAAAKDDTPTDRLLPSLPKGRPSEQQREQYAADLKRFADRLQEIDSTVDFKVSSRGWCYILENECGLSKGDFDKAQKLINDCRKTGLLPIDFTVEDESRGADNLEECDAKDPAEFAVALVAGLHRWNEYSPESFWDYQPVYVQMVVEKIDLKYLFMPVCQQYRVPIMNSRGWSDLNQRAGLMRRFRDHERHGRKPVLLYCGDHDPVGLQIPDTLPQHFEQLAQAVGWSPRNLTVVRFGLNADFIEENGLSWIDGLKTGSGDDLGDPKHRMHKANFVQQYIAKYGKRKVEANALVVRPEAGRQLCREAIEKHLDLDAIGDYEESLAEQRERAREVLPQAIRRFLEQLEGGQ